MSFNQQKSYFIKRKLHQHEQRHFLPRQQRDTQWLHIVLIIS